MKKRYVEFLLLIAFIFMMTGIGFGQDDAKGKTGMEEFQTSCSSCHPGGGNVIKPDKPIRVSKSLVNFKTFLTWIRKPEEPMPPFPPSKISDKQAKELYDYIVKASKNEWK